MPALGVVTCIAHLIQPVVNDRPMMLWSHSKFAAIKHWIKNGALALLLIVMSTGLSAAQWDGGGSSARESRLPQGNAITDGKALLRYALPIDNAPVRKLQVNLEDIATQLRANRRWNAIKKDLVMAERVLNQPETLLASVAESDRPKAEALIQELQANVAELQEISDAKDKEALWLKRGEALDHVSDLEELMVPDFPFSVPAEYANLPRLEGRATISFETSKGEVQAVVDGYSAPITAGNFVDLVQRGFYDGLEFIRAEDFYVLQVGDPPGPEEGFVDPKTGKYRGIPLEVLVQGDSEPIYGSTLEDLGLYRAEPVLPFSAFGTLGMARPGDEPNGGSSQFFFFLFEPELTPAGLNLLDGRYAVFGYVTEGKEVLEKLKQDDKIETARVIRGAENLVTPAA